MSLDYYQRFSSREISSIDEQEILEIDEYIRKKLLIPDGDEKTLSQLKILEKIALKSPQESDRITAQKEIDILKKQMENVQKQRLYNCYLKEVLPVLEKIQECKSKRFFGCKIAESDPSYKTLSQAKMDFAKIASKYTEIRFKKVEIVLCDCNAETITEEGYIICKGCGLQESINQESVTFKDLARINIAPKSNYNPKQNFDQIILKYQAKNNFQVPKSVYKTVKKEAESTGISLKKITKRNIYEILKRNKLSSYYPGIGIIHYNLTGVTPPVINHLKDQIDEVYEIIEKAYSELRGENNSLNGWFKLYKILALLNFDCHREDFLFSISEKSLEDYESIWSKIIDTLQKTEKKRGEKFWRNLL